MDFEAQYRAYKLKINDLFSAFLATAEPAALYEPIRYTLSGGGKRVRPVLTLLCAEVVGGAADDALYGAAAVEILHNFTLVHDDIMDAAEKRRNRATIHTKWDQNTAILAGDCMASIATTVLLQSSDLSRLRELTHAFAKGIVEVCEGQAMDLAFQDKTDVSLEEYLTMIEKKTGKMLELAVTTGGYLGGGDTTEIEALCSFALLIGRAFQIQDDLLDIIADTDEFGKTTGGDIVEGKKTYLIIRALEKATTPEDKKLLEIFLREKGLPQAEAPRIRALFENTGVILEAKRQVEQLTTQANEALDALRPSRARDMLHWFAQSLIQRRF